MGDAPERKQRKTVAPSRKTTVGHFSSLTVAGSLQKCPAGTRISHSRESTSPRFTSNRAVSRGTGPQEGRSAFAPVSTLLPLALALDEGVRPRTPDAEVVPGTSIQAVAKAAEQSIVAEAAEQPVRPRPPTRRSLRPSPLRVSFPPSPQMTSAAAVPVRTSAPGVPTTWFRVSAPWAGAGGHRCADVPLQSPRAQLAPRPRHRVTMIATLSAGSENPRRADAVGLSSKSSIRCSWGGAEGAEVDGVRSGARRPEDQAG